MLEDLALWAGVLAVLLIVVTWKLVADGEARKRLRVAALFLVVGAAVAAIGTVGHLRFVRLLGVVGVGVALVRAILVLLFDILPILRRTPKIVRDINAGITYFLALMVVLAGAGVKIESLLTTSALLTAVIGFALQDTLANLVAGLALQAQRPFSVGDWIKVEGGSVAAGKVVEINWRATRVVTLDQVEVSYPNSVLAKTPVTNYSLPTKVSRRSLYLHAGYQHAPDRVCELLVASARETAGVLSDPPSTAVASSFDNQGIQYCVRFFIDDWSERDIMDHRVWTRLWYALEREGIAVPYPTQSLYLHEVSQQTHDRARERSVAERLGALGAVDFLDPLLEQDRRRLAEQLRVRPFAPGETILRQGDEGQSFFLIREGEVSVHVAGPDTPSGAVMHPGASNEVARLKAGQFFGEMSLMTGDPRAATVRAESRAELYEIDHEAFAAVLLGHEEVAKQMSTILAERQIVLGERGSAIGDAPNKEARSELLFTRIKKFFRL
jgi:small-conductance mechanosensitive channel/CRP-like cAMP-binding protein